METDLNEKPQTLYERTRKLRKGTKRIKVTGGKGKTKYATTGKRGREEENSRKDEF